jgi:hypothetical protein
MFAVVIVDAMVRSNLPNGGLLIKHLIHFDIDSVSRIFGF